MTPLKNIHVHPSADRLDPAVKVALACLVPARFVDCENLAACERGDAVISLSGNDEILARAASQGLRCFHVAARTAGSAAPGGDSRIRFGDSTHLDPLLRRRTLAHKALSDLAPVTVQADDVLLARYGECPVWVFRKSGDFAADIVSAPLPRMTNGEQPFDYLDGLQFIQLLPLLHFLRQVTADVAWTRPPLRACFTFDDPNLHWISYGHLSYPELVNRAKAGNFHVSFATIPRDAWGANQRAVDLFKNHAKQLSLVIHGNDHPRDEFGQTFTADEYRRVLAQSLRRIAGLEARTGLRVARVMVPPHEALADTALSVMPALGFEGASLTPWSIRYWNPKRRSPSAFGLEMTEMTEGGSPVIPRFKLAGLCEGLMVITAFLGRPIVPFGHHEMVADGFDLLCRAAEVINSFGNVSWGSPEMILRSSYLTFRQDAVLRVKLYSSRIALTIPEGITSVTIEETSNALTALEFRITGKQTSKPRALSAAAGAPVNVTAGDTVEVWSANLGSVDYRSVAAPHYSPWALPRRILCEGRDRLVPLMSRRGSKPDSGR